MAIENSNREIRMESLSEAEETRNTAAEEIGAKQTEVEENVTPATAVSMQTPAEDGASAPSQTCAAQEPAAASDATAGGAVAEEPASGVAETDARKDDDAEPESAESAEPETEEADEESSGAVSEDDLSGKSKEELVDMFARMLETEPVQTLRKSMEAIKVAFYKLHRAEVEAARKAFEATAAEGEEFVPAVDALEVRLKDLFKEYRRRRDEYMANLDSIKEENLKAKLAIIDELKELVNSDETLNHTFAKFRELQQRWKEIGVVPQQNVKDLWETYNLHVENFYNFIKINKELRDLDLKKNYEQKLQLCEQAEALITEPSTVEAFHKLQKLHDEWRETGPVANEYKDALWERFKAASTRINKQHQEYFERIKLQEAGKKTEEVVIAYDALAVVVHPSNPVSKLTREQLEAIFTGKIRNWKEVDGPDMKIVAYSRETSSGTYEFFKESVLKNKNYKNGILSMPATGAIIQSVSQTKGAIGYVGLAYLNKAVKPLHVSYSAGKSYVEPSLENATNKSYPIIRPLFYYYEVKNASKVRPFIDYVLSPEGQELVKEVGYIPVE